MYVAIYTATILEALDPEANIYPGRGLYCETVINWKVGATYPVRARVK